YDPEIIRRFNSDSVNYEHDKHETIEILNRWKRNLKNEFGIDKPPLVLFCASGGGIRSSVWTFTVMQKLDSVSNGMFGRYCRLITGASGGMIGASYYRELLLEQNAGKIKNPGDKKYLEYMSQDILNPVAFCIATSDVFIRYQHFKDGPYSYTIDRGYFFEKELNDNLRGAFSKRLYEYKMPEENAEIPMVVISPTIINHGRKLIISPLNTSYFNYHNDKDFIAADGAIEFKRFFRDQNSVNLRYSTALRMNATFPFVMPMVSLPTEPGTEVMDAGIRDNYGTSLTVKFITEFKNWIQNNTSGVIIITTRDRPRVLNMPKVNNSLYSKMSVPAANLVDNVFYTQDFENDLLLENLMKLSGLNIKVIDFYL
ncbi:MAG TPA: patatin-like phospholipase family protein, partial [Flavobacteriales bacterium]|nr:patatin-like phospholipase family protein [Flavobacteriales bacterium]